jgi:hypothetical protein
MLKHPGFAWLHELTWPIDAAVFDGEACAGDGHDGIQAVFTERKRRGGDLAFCAFARSHSVPSGNQAGLPQGGE